jgi:hypothetical protein
MDLHIPLGFSHIMIIVRNIEKTVMAVVKEKVTSLPLSVLKLLHNVRAFSQLFQIVQACLPDFHA